MTSLAASRLTIKNGRPFWSGVSPHQTSPRATTSGPTKACCAIAESLGNHTLHVSCRLVYPGHVERVNVTLEDEQAQKLLRLAERMHVQPGTVARSLLAQALDDADPDPRNVVALLDGIDGAYDRAQLGLRQARSGQTVSVDEL